MSWKFKPNQEFMDLVNDPNLTNQQIAKLLGISVNVCNHRLKALGIKRRTMQSKGRDEQLKIQIKELILAGEKTSKILKKLGIHQSRLTRLAYELGLQDRLPRVIIRADSKKIRAEIAKLEATTQMSAVEIAQKLGCSHTTVGRWLKESARDRRNRLLAQRREDLKIRIKEMLLAHAKVEEITLELKTSYRMIKTLATEMGINLEAIAKVKQAKKRLQRSHPKEKSFTPKVAIPKKPSPRPPAFAEAKKATDYKSIAQRFDRRTGALITEKPDFSGYKIKNL